MAEALLESEKQKKKNLMISAIHQQQRELEAPEVKEKQEVQIKEAQQKRDETKKLINQSFAKNREDIQKRLAERARRRTSSRGPFNQSMITSSQGLMALSATL